MYFTYTAPLHAGTYGHVVWHKHRNIWACGLAQAYIVWHTCIHHPLYKISLTPRHQDLCTHPTIRRYLITKIIVMVSLKEFVTMGVLLAAAAQTHYFSGIDEAMVKYLKKTISPLDKEWRSYVI